MSEKPTVYEALSRVMAAVQAVRKGDRNREQGYDFRGIDSVVNAVGPALREHGVLVVPELLEVGYRDVLTVREKRSRECTVKVRFRFHGPAGDHVDAVTPGESMDFGDKGAAKAMSVAFRIALLQALCIPTDEPENDPDAHSYERADRRAPSPRATELFEQITAAASTEELSRLWQDVNGAAKAGEVGAAEAEQLKVHITRRGAEHKPAVAMVTPSQHKRIHMLWRELGFAGEEHREQRLTRTAAIVGRDLQSSADLTESEAVEVIRTLAAAVQPADGAAS